MTAAIRIAMWSGPRNLSTTLMRSFGARADTAVVDEPFYAVFLRLTGLKHPMTDAILAHHETDPEQVIRTLTGAVPGGRAIFYQKHMIHHMVPGIRMDWLDRIGHHVMLVRHPARVIRSYLGKMDTLSLEAIGVREQWQLWSSIAARAHRPPPVIDADRVLAEPESILQRLCGVLGITWDPAMLAWAPGPRAEDGVWAPHWYDAVWRSTGFGDPPGELPTLDGEARGIEKEALAYYERLLEGHV